MPLTADEIQDRKFPVGLRGYDKDEVDAFLAQVAADYQLALDAIASADPYGTLGHEVTDVLRYAKETAESLTRSARAEAEKILAEAQDEATKIREQAVEEAAATLEAARAEAARLKADSEARARATDDEVQNLQRRALEEVADLRRKAEEEAAGTLESAGEKAIALVREAERHAAELRESAESKYHQRLDEATQRHATLKAQERELNERVVEVGRTLQRLLAQLQPGDPALQEDFGTMVEMPRGDQVVDVRAIDADDGNTKA